MPKTCSFETKIRREIPPYTPNAWYQPDSVKISYEIGFTRYDCKPQPARTLAEILPDIPSLENET